MANGAAERAAMALRAGRRERERSLGGRTGAGSIAAPAPRVRLNRMDFSRLLAERAEREAALGERDRRLVVPRRERVLRGANIKWYRPGRIAAAIEMLREELWITLATR